MNVATRWTFGLLVPFATSCSWILDLPPPVDDHCRDDDGTLNCYRPPAWWQAGDKLEHAARRAVCTRHRLAARPKELDEVQHLLLLLGG